jgi:hypothetical protein
MTVKDRCDDPNSNRSFHCRQFLGPRTVTPRACALTVAKIVRTWPSAEPNPARCHTAWA